MENIFGLIKPKGPTSHDIVDRVRRITGKKKVGHAGTLDPLASGVLVVGVGREATKKLGEVVKEEKEYIATIKLGETSATDDEEGKKLVESSKCQATRSDVDNILKKFLGKIKQTPPVYSAIKVKGKPAHRRVRKGEKVELKSREIEIKEIELLDYRWPILKIRVVTGPGVYIRSLARDLGEELQVGGYLKRLKRTRVGTFNIENSITLEEFQRRNPKI